MKKNDLLLWMQNKGMAPSPVQGFAFGGIANPAQRARLRSSDQEYLDKRLQELNAYEAQRAAYNTGLTKYQEEVYKPYQSQAEAYNTAAQKYNEEVYNPYKSQYEGYEKAIAEYNAGPRTTDYAGPTEPTLASKFEMTAPTAPEAFSMLSPEAPFKEEEVAAYQQEAAQRARADAADRGVAIDVITDPDKYNFGSMSVSNRFMAEGGLVEDEDVVNMAKGGDVSGLHPLVQAAVARGDIEPKQARYYHDMYTTKGSTQDESPIRGMSEKEYNYYTKLLKDKETQKNFYGGEVPERRPPPPPSPANTDLSRE